MADGRLDHAARSVVWRRSDKRNDTERGGGVGLWTQTLACGKDSSEGSEHVRREDEADEAMCVVGTRRSRRDGLRGLCCLTCRCVEGSASNTNIRESA